MNLRYKRRGWHGESYRHYLASKGVKTSQNRYYYNPTYAQSDLPLIAADGVGTAGAAAVSLIPLAIVAGGLYLGGRGIKRKSEGKSFFADKVPLDQANWRVKWLDNENAEMVAGFETREAAENYRKQLMNTGTVDYAYVESDRDYYSKKDRSAPELKVEKPVEGHKYPVSPKEVKEILDNQGDHAKGLKSIEFSNPKGDQKGAWAQYVRSRRAIKIFSQPYHARKLDRLPADKVNNHMKRYVIPHEIGHHRALSKHKITDKDLRVAEARADAHVLGLSPRDDAVKTLVQHR